MTDAVGLAATPLAAHGGVYTSSGGTGASTYTLLNDLDLVQQVGLMSTALNGSHARRVIPTNDFSTHDP